MELRLPPSDMHGRYLFDATRAGLWPFKARIINSWVQQDFDPNRYAIFVEVWIGNLRLVETQFIDAIDLANDPYKAMFEASKKFFKAFRNKEGLPVHDNIFLGEN